MSTLSNNIRVKKMVLFIFAIMNTFCLCGQVHPCMQKASNHNYYQTIDWEITNSSFNIGEKLLAIIFHVIEHPNVPHVTDQQILAQIAVLNQDYASQNDQSNISSSFLDLVADIEVEFCLAVRMPNGESTSGIMRYQTDIEEIGLSNALYDLAPNIAPDHYINIWIAKLPNGINGKASFPGNDPPQRDGIIISPDAFGVGGSSQEPYNLGRTLTHELGHYFGLFHIFGQGDCLTDDGLDDTPNCSNNYLGLCPSGFEFSCESIDMYMNFMSFANDACMSMFTQNQKTIVWNTLSKQRATLLDSQACMMVSTNNIIQSSPNIYPNPIINGHEISFFNLHFPIKAKIYNLQGNLVKKLAVTLTNNSVSTIGLESGVYFINIIDVNSNSYLKKILIL